MLTASDYYMLQNKSFSCHAYSHINSAYLLSAAAKVAATWSNRNTHSLHVKDMVVQKQNKWENFSPSQSEVDQAKRKSVDMRRRESPRLQERFRD